MSGMHRHRLKLRLKKTRISFQRTIQLLSAALFNGYAAGFRKGRIFTGSSKAVCVPVLNCYSCPGALGACPIGALQEAVGGRRHFPFYALGLLMLSGILLGRAVCGLLGTTPEALKADAERILGGGQPPFQAPKSARKGTTRFPRLK